MRVPLPFVEHFSAGTQLVIHTLFGSNIGIIAPVIVKFLYVAHCGRQFCFGDFSAFLTAVAVLDALGVSDAVRALPSVTFSAMLDIQLASDGDDGCLLL